MSTVVFLWISQYRYDNAITFIGTNQQKDSLIKMSYVSLFGLIS